MEYWFTSVPGRKLIKSFDKMMSSFMSNVLQKIEEEILYYGITRTAEPNNLAATKLENRMPACAK